MKRGQDLESPGQQSGGRESTLPVVSTGLGDRWLPTGEQGPVTGSENKHAEAA